MRLAFRSDGKDRGIRRDDADDHPGVRWTAMHGKSGVRDSDVEPNWLVVIILVW